MNRGMRNMRREECEMRRRKIQRKEESRWRRKMQNIHDVWQVRGV